MSAVRTHAQWQARRNVVSQAFFDADQRWRALPLDAYHHPERVEWGLLRSQLEDELNNVKRQMTKAARREGLSS